MRGVMHETAELGLSGRESRASRLMPSSALLHCLVATLMADLRRSPVVESLLEAVVPVL